MLLSCGGIMRGMRMTQAEPFGYPEMIWMKIFFVSDDRLKKKRDY